MPSLSAKNISVSLYAGGFFKKTKILRDISFDLQQGDRLALIGDNGAGKSTLLKTLGGVLVADSGTLEVEGKVSALYNIRLGTRKMSTGRRNMVMRNLLEGRPYEEIMEKLPSMIKFADIGEYIDKPMDTYSAGMAMRVVFASATAFDPEILLLDEWIGAGDVKFRAKSQRRMQRLVRKSGIIVLATHRKKLAFDTCNLGLYIKNGETAAYGPIEEVWDQYEKDSA